MFNDAYRDYHNRMRHHLRSGIAPGQFGLEQEGYERMLRDARISALAPGMRVGERLGSHASHLVRVRLDLILTAARILASVLIQDDRQMRGHGRRGRSFDNFLRVDRVGTRQRKIEQ